MRRSSALTCKRLVIAYLLSSRTVACPKESNRIQLGLCDPADTAFTLADDDCASTAVTMQTYFLISLSPFPSFVQAYLIPSSSNYISPELVNYIIIKLI
ncbi:hypothetical protein Nepgr_031078 [Nepenthes gracilis]|uniref:Secreted protein n=1 Tax=Nepenthes gracilis TaxID=150966 RepID=A0AAD3Y6G2_NEPGR|nr:hypothetical protein Nepgr_031078 [Nepenthes gracilis]